MATNPFAGPGMTLTAQGWVQDPFTYDDRQQLRSEFRDNRDQYRDAGINWRELLELMQSNQAQSFAQREAAGLYGGIRESRRNNQGHGLDWLKANYNPDNNPFTAGPTPSPQAPITPPAISPTPQQTGMVDGFSYTPMGPPRNATPFALPEVATGPFMPNVPLARIAEESVPAPAAVPQAPTTTAFPIPGTNIVPEPVAVSSPNAPRSMTMEQWQELARSMGRGDWGSDQSVQPDFVGPPNPWIPWSFIPQWRDQVDRPITTAQLLANDPSAGWRDLVDAGTPFLSDVAAGTGKLLSLPAELIDQYLAFTRPSQEYFFGQPFASDPNATKRALVEWLNQTL